MKKYIAWLLCGVAYLTPHSAISGSFSSYSSEHDKLSEHKIIYAGNLAEERRWGDSSSRDSSLINPQNTKLYALGGFCFYADSFVSYSAAMLVADKFGQPKLAIFDSSGSNIQVRLQHVRLLNCNDIRNADTQRTLDEVKAIKENIERQQQQTQQLMKELQERERRRKTP